jgi:hypothetical protein
LGIKQEGDMKRKIFGISLLAIFCLLLPLYAQEMEKEEGTKEEVSRGKRILGKENINTKEKLSKYSTIVLKDFSLEDTKIHKDMDVQIYAKKLPANLSNMISEYLKEMGLFTKIVRYEEGKSYEDAIILEGRFTKITPGSTAAKLIVGFGAGSSTVGAEGEIKESKTGDVLASFEHNRHSPFSVAPGKPEQILEADAKNLAKDIASFIKKLY